MQCLLSPVVPAKLHDVQQSSCVGAWRLCVQVAREEETQAEQADFERQLSELQTALKAAQSRAEQADSRLAVHTQEAEAAARTAQQTQQELSEALEQLAQAQADALSARVEAKDAAQALELVNQEHEQAMKAVDELAAALAAVEANSKAAEQEAADVKAELVAAGEALQEAQQELEGVLARCVCPACFLCGTASALLPCTIHNAVSDFL